MSVPYNGFWSLSMLFCSFGFFCVNDLHGWDITRNTKVIAIPDRTSMKVMSSFAAIVLLQQQWQLCKERRKNCYVFAPITGKRRSKNTIYVIWSRPASTISFVRMFPFSDDVPERKFQKFKKIKGKNWHIPLLRVRFKCKDLKKLKWSQKQKLNIS